MIQVYTGNGKGKTTACLGLAIRAAGAGLKVFICQFVKNIKCSELNSLKKIKNITIEQFGSGCFVRTKARPKDKQAAVSGLKRAGGVIDQKRFDVVILDEINVAVHLGLVNPEEVAALIEKTPSNIELILTGRNAHAGIIKKADLVSEIKEVKHYYKRGVKARRGIEY